MKLTIAILVWFIANWFTFLSTITQAQADHDHDNLSHVWIDLETDNLSLTWLSKLGRFYDVETSTDLVTFETLISDYPTGGATGETTSFPIIQVDSFESGRYYRVREVLTEDASPRTALMYARESEKYLGPFPKFRYEEAIEIPITQDGKLVIVTESNIGQSLSFGDKPAAFDTPYQLGNRVGRYQGTNPDGSPNPDVVFVTFFRDGGLGVIGHNIRTGATCFLSIKDEINGKQDLPTPDESRYNEVWQPPSVVAKDGCVKCHMADPFLHSPWIDQVLDPENPRQTLVPLIADSDSPYYVIGKEFPTPPGRKPGSAQATIPKHLEGNSCVRCHAPQCVPEFFNVKLDELKMGAPFHTMEVETREQWVKDRDAIREYCRSLDIQYFEHEDG